MISCLIKIVVNVQFEKLFWEGDFLIYDKPIIIYLFILQYRPYSLKTHLIGRRQTNKYEGIVPTAKEISNRKIDLNEKVQIIKT